MINRIISDYSLLCAEGVPLLMEDHRPRPCQPRPWLPEHKCPASFWCHEGDDESSYYCCPKNRKFENRCHLPPATGHGTLSMRRFYYDWMSDGCHELHYTGIGGNENSFMTYESCEEACRGELFHVCMLALVFSSCSKLYPLSKTSTSSVRKVTESATSSSPESYESSPEDEQLQTLWQDTNPCEAPASAGSPGGIARKMWYFDESAISCVPFVFLGSGGNANRFADQGTCMRTCGSGKPTRASCELPSQFGNGTFKIPRYYFDKTAKQCELFYYSGNGGNENRFLKKAKCERLCLGSSFNFFFSFLISSSLVSFPDSASPTTAAAPTPTQSETSSDQILRKSSSREETNQNYTSSSEEATTLDPFPTLINIPKGIGQQILFASSFFRCKILFQSSYHHSHNFTAALFQQVALDVSPCQSPLRGDVVIMCVLDGVTCPAGTFCQVGDAQSICCPTLPEPQCEQPQRPGVGTSTLLRWYYKPSTRQCHMFVFHGFQGNQNNFESLQECESTCRDLNPCEEGAPLPAIDGSQKILVFYTFFLFLFLLPLECSIQSLTRHVLYFRLMKMGLYYWNGMSSECLMPEDAGHGVESSHRWSYDSPTRKCVSFIYHGYGGNQNNFLSRNDCETACIPTNPCDQPVSSGHGNKFISRFFFSKEYGQCLHFAYSGEGGNSNNFANLRECVDTCMSNSSYFRCKLISILAFELLFSKLPESFCLQPRPPLNVCLSPNSPPVQRIQFTYDPLADRCVRFSYSSCSPDYNLNHFETDSQCQRLCCNQGYDLVYKRKLLMLNDSPLDDSEDSDRL
ncbi:unnamed protein product [Haemonchus placei]|uniref:BPTI/Kunitz inhibitor domain-containing protein n=1 Tax=Haemonchus placei TaxID=6290 RepID=A0A3P7Y6Z3_HAEPC|nr:unnamed protein product [Haemonchus placei]